MRSLMRRMITTLSIVFFFSSRRRHTRYWRDWSSDVCSSDLLPAFAVGLKTWYAPAETPYNNPDSRVEIGMRGQKWKMMLKRAVAAPVLSAKQIGRASCRERV